MKIARDLLQTVVDHALRDAPNECCGMIAVRGGVAAKVYELENAQPSPFRFEIDPQTLRETYMAIDDAGCDMCIYHSHTRSDPVPSPTDVNFGVNWPGTEWLIVGTKGETTYRSWLIDPDGQVTEVPVEVTD